MKADDIDSEELQSTPPGSTTSQISSDRNSSTHISEKDSLVKVLDLALSGTSTETQTVTLNDYKKLLHLSSARIACFELRDPADIHSSADEFVRKVWAESTVCLETSKTFLRAFDFKDKKQALLKPFAFFFNQNHENIELAEKWFNSGFTITDYETIERHNGHNPVFLQNSIYGIIENEKLLRFWIVTKDISEYKRAIQATIDAEKHYRTMVERPGLILIRRSSAHYLSYITPSVLDVFGYPPRDFKNDPGLFERLIHPSDRQNFSRLAHARENKLKRPVEAEYRMLCKNSTYHWFFERQTPKFITNNEIEYFDSVILDVQEKKQLEASLLQAQKMETIGKLSGGIAHDFNNHLTAILGQISLSLNDLSPHDPSYSKLVLAEKAALSCAEITSQLLSFSRKSDENFISIELSKLTDETQKLASHILPSNIRIESEIDQSAQAFFGNFVQIQQVLMNLVINARDSMMDGGVICLNACMLSSADELHAQYFPKFEADKFILFSVSDEGCGIPASQIEHIFEPFFTTKKSGHGTGLGLSMVYSIIKSHGGEIAIRSTVRVGTEVFFILPRADLAAVKPVMFSQLESLKGSELILLAEDEKSIQDMIRTALTNLGYKLLIANDGNEAVMLYEENMHSISLLLLDESMPGLNGTDVIRKIRTEKPVILTSGYSDQEIADSFKNNVSFLSKPYKLNVLIEKIRKLIDFTKKSLPTTLS